GERQHELDCGCVPLGTQPHGPHHGSHKVIDNPEADARTLAGGVAGHLAAPIPLQAERGVTRVERYSCADDINDEVAIRDRGADPYAGVLVAVLAGVVEDIADALLQEGRVDVHQPAAEVPDGVAIDLEGDASCGVAQYLRVVRSGDQQSQQVVGSQ